MKYGDQSKICKLTGISKSVVSCYFSNTKNVGKEKKIQIESAIKAIEAEHKENVKFNHAVKKNRYDIYNNLPHGALTKISKKVNCSIAQVKRILEGESKDNYGVIKEAELLAAIHIWKTRFCRYKSQL